MTADRNTMTATWTGGRRFVHTSASGHGLVTDTSVEFGGADTAPSPMELIILGLIGCTGVDVSSILERMREPLRSLEVTATYERSDTHPKVFTRIHLTYTLEGDLDQNKVQRAIELSHSKYCSVSAMLASSVDITHKYVVEN
jgi:putative redox protein